MKIGETKELLDQIPKEHIPLMKMIDKKIDNDMDKVLNKMDSLKVEVSSMDKRLEDKVSSMDKRMEDKMSTMQNLLWGTLIGLGLVLIAGVVSMIIAIYNK